MAEALGCKQHVIELARRDDVLQTNMGACRDALCMSLCEAAHGTRAHTALDTHSIQVARRCQHMPRVYTDLAVSLPVASRRHGQGSAADRAAQLRVSVIPALSMP